MYNCEEDHWVDGLYVYVSDVTVGLSEEVVAEESAKYVKVPAVLWLGAELGVRTATLWHRAMRDRNRSMEMRWVRGFELVGVHVAGATETWPDHCEAALERMAAGRDERPGGEEAELVARLLLELSYNQVEMCEREKWLQ